MRVGVILGAVTALAVVLTVVAPGAIARPEPSRFALGDSVMLGARSELRQHGFRVDADESRQAYKGPALLRARGAGLPRNVVVHLGTNGTFPLSTCKRMIQIAGKDRRVFLVTDHASRSWIKSNNRVIRTCAASFAEGRVHVVDWDWAASRHPQWLYADRIHLKPAGKAAFAHLIDYAVDRYGALG